MADNIGTQLVSNLEEIARVHGIMESLSNIGTGLRTFKDFEAFVNVFEFVECHQNQLFSDFHTFMLQKVVPIVAHINDRV
jgi:hypothetical protein